MSKHSALSKSFRSVLLLCLITFPLPCEVMARNHQTFLSDAMTLHLNGVLSGEERTSAEILFELEIPRSGIVTLDAVLPGTTPVEATIRFLDCPPITSASTMVIERFADHLVFVARTPGVCLFRVSAQDPLLPLGVYQIRAGFVPVGDATKEEDPDEIEIDPNPFTGSLAPSLCRKAVLDDHGDTLTCATFLRAGQPITAEIRNGWGNDYDVFLFSLPNLRMGSSLQNELWTVYIESAGGTDTFGRLYDHHGQRLKSDDDGGRDRNFRIVKTLQPGLYFVRVEGRDGAVGPYELSLKTLR